MNKQEWLLKLIDYFVENEWMERSEAEQYVSSRDWSAWFDNDFTPEEVGRDEVKWWARGETK